VTEYVPGGSLRQLLENTAIKLPWAARLDLLRSAARGVAHLHAQQPPIVHRDLKPSNMLVEQLKTSSASLTSTTMTSAAPLTTWNVKVADFGLARLKQDNATMTSCGTPCWTAPEVIRGWRYDERADVYSFGIVMWQVASRRRPYDGRNFMGVLTDVLAGARPSPLPMAAAAGDTVGGGGGGSGSGVSGGCPAELVALMQRCWAAEPDERPSMAQVVECLESLGTTGGVASPV
jgi:serine/threonine protein kinase